MGSWYTRSGHIVATAICLIAPPFGAIAASVLPNAPSNICIDDSGCVNASAQGSSSGVKWHPGHYMQIMRGSYEQSQSVRFGWYDQIGSSSALTGVSVGFRWAQLEGAQGDYTAGIALVRAEINKLKSLRVPKRLIIRVMDNAWGSGCPASSYFPSYLNNMGLLYGNNDGCFWQRWNSAAMGHFINMLNAYAAVFDNEPYFEALIPTRETPLPPGANSYSASADQAQFNRLALALKNSWKNTIVSMPTSYVVSESFTSTYIAYLSSLGMGAGNMDVCPDCNMWADRTIRGASGGIDHRGKIPIIYSVEASELGFNSVGPDGGYTPSQIYNWTNATQRVTHLMWDRNEATGSPSQRWTSGILPFINANPLTNTRCPTSLTTCDTD